MLRGLEVETTDGRTHERMSALQPFYVLFVIKRNFSKHKKEPHQSRKKTLDWMIWMVDQNLP